MENTVKLKTIEYGKSLVLDKGEGPRILHYIKQDGTTIEVECVVIGEHFIEIPNFKTRPLYMDKTGSMSLYVSPNVKYNVYTIGDYGETTRTQTYGRDLIVYYDKTN